MAKKTLFVILFLLIASLIGVIKYNNQYTPNLEKKFAPDTLSKHFKLVNDNIEFSAYTLLYAFLFENCDADRLKECSQLNLNDFFSEYTVSFQIDMAVTPDISKQFKAITEFIEQTAKSGSLGKKVNFKFLANNSDADIIISIIDLNTEDSFLNKNISGCDLQRQFDANKLISAQLQISAFQLSKFKTNCSTKLLYKLFNMTYQMTGINFKNSKYNEIQFITNLNFIIWLRKKAKRPATSFELSQMIREYLTLHTEKYILKD